MYILPKKVMKSFKKVFVAMGGVLDGYRGTQMDGESQALKRLKSNSQDWQKYREAVEKLRSRRNDNHPEEKITLSNKEEITISL